MKICPKCNKNYDDSWAICLGCSEKLVDGLSVPERVVTESEVPPAELKKPKKTVYEKFPFLAKLLLLAFLIGIPLTSFIVMTAVQTHYENKVIAQLKELYIQSGEPVSENLQPGILAYVCTNTEQSKEPYCKEFNTLSLIKDVALITCVISILLFIAIWFIGFIGQIHRIVLVVLFTLGMYASLFMGIILLLINGGLLMASIYYGESAAVGRIHYGIMLGIGLAVISGVLGLIRPALGAIKKSEARVKGKSIKEDSFPEIWDYGKKVSSKLGALPPEHIVVGLDETFFVTQSDVYCFDGKLKGRTLFLSLPLMRQLETEEVLAIIGHELGHFRGADTLYSQRFYPIYRGTAEGLSIMESGTSSNYGVVFLPAYALFIHFMQIFSKIESKIGRKRELIADKAGSELTSNSLMGSALTKVHAYSGIWQFLVEEEMIRAINGGKQITNCSSYYGSALEVVEEKALIQNLKEATLQHPTDTHPSLDVRLKELGFNLNSFISSIRVKPMKPGIQLVARYEEIEKELSELEHALLIRTGRAKLPETEESTTTTTEA